MSFACTIYSKDRVCRGHTCVTREYASHKYQPMVTRRLRRQKKKKETKRNKEEERSTRKEEPVSRGFQPPQNDPSGLPVRLRLPPLYSPPAKALAPVHHLPIYPPTYLPIYLSTCFSLFHRLSLPFPLAQTCWPTYLIRLQGFELAAFLTEWRLDIPRGVNRWQKPR